MLLTGFPNACRAATKAQAKGQPFPCAALADASKGGQPLEEHRRRASELQTRSMMNYSCLTSLGPSNELQRPDPSSPRTTKSRNGPLPSRPSLFTRLFIQLPRSKGRITHRTSQHCP